MATNNFSRSAYAESSILGQKVEKLLEMLHPRGYLRSSNEAEILRILSSQ